MKKEEEKHKESTLIPLSAEMIMNGIFNDEKKKEIKCKHCPYVWTPRIKNPKSCPRCKRRLDV